MGVGIGRAKLLLLGEHAAVHGHLAVGLTLPFELKVTYRPGSGWNDAAWGAYAEPVGKLVARLSELASERGLPPPVPGSLSAESDVVPEGGLGSSAALCAALVNVFYPDLDAAAKDELAWRAEFLFHGTPSGIDTALAFRRGWWALEPGIPGRSPARPRALPDPGLVLVIGSIVRSADTKTLVASVSRRLVEGDAAVRRGIGRLGNLAAQAAASIAAGQKELAPLVVQAREELRTLGLETPPLTAVLDAGLACPGALAGKLSGAGAGGAFFLLFRDAETARAALPSIRSALPDGQWRLAPALLVP